MWSPPRPQSQLTSGLPTSGPDMATYSRPGDRSKGSSSPDNQDLTAEFIPGSREDLKICFANPKSPYITLELMFLRWLRWGLLITSGWCWPPQASCGTEGISASFMGSRGQVCSQRPGILCQHNRTSLKAPQRLGLRGQ